MCALRDMMAYYGMMLLRINTVNELAKGTVQSESRRLVQYIL